LPKNGASNRQPSKKAQQRQQNTAAAIVERERKNMEDMWRQREELIAGGFMPG
jgi:hypothetical protein